MNITVIGTGYVGLVTGACFAEMGHTVFCVDIDEAKLERLRQGEIPIHEPGLDDLVSENHQLGRLRFTTSLAQAMEEAGILIICVGTPPAEDGSADVRHVLAVAQDIGRHLRRPSIVVDKSIVPVGTADKVRACIQAELDRRAVQIGFDVVSYPEFLKEGAAVNDFMSPDRIVIGADSVRAREAMAALYAPFIRNHPRLIHMPVRDAEMTKYAANAMLATKISFMNEVANSCEQVGVDVENVRIGIGSDERIGFHFIYAGAGYGGSCFPKDVNALIGMAREVGVDAMVLNAVKERNERQRERLFQKIHAHFDGKLAGKTIAVWGLAFKPGTDDMREAPSQVLINALLGAGACVKAYDPVAMPAARQVLDAAAQESGALLFAAAQYEAAIDADALVLVTEWKPFRRPEFRALARLMRSTTIFDGRNQYEPSQLAELGFVYYGMGRSGPAGVTRPQHDALAETTGLARPGVARSRENRRIASVFDIK